MPKLGRRNSVRWGKPDNVTATKFRCCMTVTMSYADRYAEHIVLCIPVGIEIIIKTDNVLTTGQQDGEI